MARTKEVRRATRSAASDPSGKRKVGRPQKFGQRPYVLGLRLPAELHRQLRHYVVDHPPGTINDLVVAVLAEWWESQPERTAYDRLPKPERAR
jgi:hypothetical protein